MGHTDGCSLLLREGHAPDVYDTTDQLPVFYARGKGHMGAVGLLVRQWQWEWSMLMPPTHMPDESNGDDEEGNDHNIGDRDRVRGPGETQNPVF
ncbi:hypothetical protein PTSG_11748 [Salpingoeca rosetta]|uniref:Uncharacterized protein n=1 Tax=Salpingoeca rosetta (strain ATCC 50818 / BSB-021) TaxID=946362 RepID=F2U0I3_SALR5|nr:uncharacterized protein PTSG_11748 [Salpingoeca rosetta]EGD80911.1 hypothetical protein PTSG_11748 [Salpingoeca rosetta]|eukprot:XP_004997472.1 hypothetical protein PTSG_11748 [Salpingoeca rosetta]